MDTLQAPPRLRRLDPERLPREAGAPLDPDVQAAAAAIVEDVRLRGERALREHAERLGDLTPGAPLVVERAGLEAALADLPADHRALLERTAARIRTFAEAQRGCLRDLDLPVPGGRAGHRWLPVAAAGCYAPGGRYPLPSSVLMTGLPARIAGVGELTVASPRPGPLTLAAAAVAGADRLLAVGGAQGIAGLAFGLGGGAPADVVVGPGNAWVTAAKRHLVGEVGIDGLAGPSELVVLADGTADPELVAADLLGQAEHDPEAAPVLVTTDAGLVPRVEAALARQLEDLPTAAVARAALAGQGAAVVVPDLAAAAAVADRLAPEHLELLVADPAALAGLAERVTCYGGLFVGAGSGEVLGDYGAGPNHVLPTAGGARFQAGLSVATFLRPATFLALDGEGDEDAAAFADLAADAAALARLEGLEAHARSAERAVRARRAEVR